nr:calcium/sodium antiporter [Bacteroidota bacterium]
MVYFLFIIGFIFLIQGAGFLVDGASSVGTKLKLSPVVIGFTIVALGTSLPELIINVFASIEGETDLAISNVIGSNIMNTLFIMGAAAIIFPIQSDSKTIYTLIPISFFAAVLMGVFANFRIFGFEAKNSISTIEGTIMLLMLAVYFWYSRRFSKSEKNNSHQKIREFSVINSILLITFGMAGLFFGGKWIILGSEAISNDLGLSKAFFGITIIAVITSLPELVTSVVAAFKKNSGIALGNAVGSNIYNIFLVLGISAVIRPLPFNNVMNTDLAMVIASNVILFLILAIGKGKRIGKSEGFILMIVYLVYIIGLILRQ